MTMATRSIVILLVLCAALSARAQDLVTYPAAPHINPDEGTIEMWVRLDSEPVPDRQHHFPLFTIGKPGEPYGRVRVSYQTIWGPQHFHVFFASTGKVMGELSANQYVCTAEDTQKTVKGETAADPTPRIARLKAGEWHHIAICWQGSPRSTVSMYFDGKLVIKPVQLHAPIWEDLESFTLSLSGYVYDTISVDELRVSSVVRTEEEIKRSIDAGLTADRYTLLLDHFEATTEAGGETFTDAEVFADGLPQRGGHIVQPKRVEFVEGHRGRAVKLTRPR